MTKATMELYNRLIENPLFFEWIYYPSSEIESFWKQYLESNPTEANQILDFKSRFEKYFQHKNETLSELEKKELALKIISQLKVVAKNKNRFVFAKEVMKYAAVAILFLVIGGGLVYLYMHNNNANFITESFSETHNIQEPVLIINNNEQIPLNKEDSELEYSADGSIVINKKKVLDQGTADDNITMNTLVIPYGNRSVINLSDGTKVWLNAGSRLIYPSRFVDKTREVYLVGEAFFDVERNEDKPFIVKTSELSIKVLGTAFNVSAYPEDNVIQTVLTKGIVEITESNAGLFKKGVLLEPGQMASWNIKEKETTVYNVNTDYYTLWTDGIFSFSNTDFNRIMKKLERYYKIRFNYADPMDGMIKITGKLDVSRGQKEVFEYLERLTGLRFNKINEFIYVIK